MPGAVTVGSLVVNLSANVGSLKTDLSGATSAVSETSQSMVNSWANVSASTEGATAAGAKMIASLRDQIATFGMTDQELTQHRANLNGVGAEAQGLIARLNSMRDAESSFKAAVVDANGALAAHGTAASAAAGHVGEFSLASSGAQRELIVLAHEMLQGNYSRFGGSMLVLAEQTNAASLIFSAAGAAILGLGAAVYVVINDLESMSSDITKFNNSLALTNNYAGLTRDSMAAMSANIQTSATGGITAATTMLSGLAATGKFTGGELEAVGQTALKFGELTGQSSDQVIQYFSGMTSGIAAWADNANQSYHFMNTAQYEHIATLEKEGHSQQAVIEVMRLMNDSMDQQVQHVEPLMAIWKGWGLIIDKVNDSMRKVAFPTVNEEMNNAIKKLEDMKAAAQNGGDAVDAMGNSTGAGVNAEAIQQQAALVKSLIAQSNAAEIAAAKKQADDLSAQRGIAAQKELDQIKQNLMTQEQLRDAARAKIRADGDAIKADALQHGQSIVDIDNEVNTLIAASDAKYATAAVKDDPRPVILANALRANQDLLTAEKAKYDQLGAMDDLYHRYGVTSDDTYYAQKRDLALQYEQAQIKAYDNDLNTLANYDNQSEKEQEQTQGKINGLYAKKLLAVQQYNADVAKYTAEDALRAKVAADADAAADQKTLDGLLKTANSTEAMIGNADAYKGALERLAIAKNQDAIATEQNYIISARELGLTDQDIAAANQKIDALNAQNAALGRTADALDVLAKRKLDDQMFKDASSAAKQFETDMTSSLGNIGAAIGKLAVAYTDYGTTQHAIDVQFQKDMADAQTAKDVQAAKDAANAKFQNASAVAQVKQYADITGAAEQFFNKGSTGYKALEDAQRIFRLAEMALSIESTLVKIAGTTTSTAADTAATGVSVTNSGIRAAADGVAAVAKAIASMPFPYNLVAGAATLAALVAIGVKMEGSLSGSGSSSAPDTNSAAQVQATQGTGTVLGDATKQSDSINSSLKILVSDSNEMLPLTSQMAASLSAIENGLSGVANFILQNAGISSGSNLGIQTGQISGLNTTAEEGLSFIPQDSFTSKLNAATSNFLFGSSSSSITDAGLQLGGTVAQLEQGQGINQYANVHTSTSGILGGLFGGNSESDTTDTQAVSAQLSQQFGLIFQNLQSTLQAAATGLGKNSDDIGNAVQDVNVSVTKLSTQGLSGTALVSAINAVISATMDNITQQVLPGLDGFQQIGEGYTQTVIRVATGVEQATVALQGLGLTTINYTDIINKQGDVATELERQSIDSASSVSAGIAKIISTFQGSSTDLITLYDNLISIQKLMNDTALNGQNLTSSTIQGAGGTSQLSSGLSDYLKDYFSPAEQSAAEMKDLAAQFAALNETMPTTKDGFRALVSSIDTSTDAGQKLVGQLLSLAGAFSDAVDNANQLTTATSAATIAQQHSLDEQLLQAEGDNYAYTQATRADVLSTLTGNLLTTQEAIYAAQDKAAAVQAATTNLTSAYNAQVSALNSTISSMQAFANSIQTFKNSLTLGSDSALSPQDKYDQAKSIYETTLAAAQNGDTNAQGELQNDATAFLDASKAYNASTQAYSDDFNEVQNDMSKVADYANQQASAAQAQLAIMNAQVSSLITINTSVLSVTAAVNALIAAQNASASEQAALGFEQANGQNANNEPASEFTDWSASVINGLKTQFPGEFDNITPVIAPINGSHADGLVSVPFDGYRAILHKDEGVIDAPAMSAIRRYFNAPAQTPKAISTSNTSDNSQTLTELREQNVQLKAMVSLHSAGYQAMLAKLGDTNAALDSIRKKASLESVKPKKKATA